MNRENIIPSQFNERGRTYHPMKTNPGRNMTSGWKPFPCPTTFRTMRVLLIALGLVSMAGLVFPPFPAGIGNADPDPTVGTGTPEDPFLVGNVHDLQAIRHNLSAHYALTGDIDARETRTWNGGAGFQPLGDWDERFSGTLDGRGYRVTGLYINRASATFVGLFGSMEGARVSTICLADVDITGNSSVGGLAGHISSGTMENACVTGTVTGHGYVGGLAGYNIRGWIRDSHASGTVTGSDGVGGLVGWNEGSVYHSHASVNVTGVHRVGGLVGFNDGGSILNSHYNIEVVFINGAHHVTLGGIYDSQYRDWYLNDRVLDIEDYRGTLIPSDGYYAIAETHGLRDLLGFAHREQYRFRLVSDMDLTTEPGLYIPLLSGEFDGNDHIISNLSILQNFTDGVGLFGFNAGGSVSNIHLVDAEVTGRYYVGGLVGYNAGGSVSFSDASGRVTGSRYVGGLAGINDGGTMNRTFASGTVNGGLDSGGLLGMNRGGGRVNNSRAQASVRGEGRIGGLVGTNHGSVTHSHATGDVTRSDHAARGGGIGGLVGHNRGPVNSSFATGRITTSLFFGDVGGLVGHNEHATISQSYAWGIVTGGINTGGLVGRNEFGLLINCYARGRVTGGINTGGLVGDNSQGRVNNSFATGGVTGGIALGGLVGMGTDGEVNHSFWNLETSSLEHSAGGTGATTAEMRSPGIYMDSGWDMALIWSMLEHGTYPWLRWQQEVEPPRANAGPDKTVSEGTVVTFDGSGSTDDTAITNYTWVFHDGISTLVLYGENPRHTFSVPGTFLVTLDVTDTAGNNDSAVTTVTVTERTVPQPDMTIRLEYMDPGPRDGDLLQVILSVRNSGDVAATNVTVVVKMTGNPVETFHLGDVDAGSRPYLFFNLTVEKGSHILDIELTHDGGGATLSFPVRVASGDGERSESFPLEALMLMLAVSIAAMFLIGSMRMRGNRGPGKYLWP